MVRLKILLGGAIALLMAALGTTSAMASPCALKVSAGGSSGGNFDLSHGAGPGSPLTVAGDSAKVAAGKSKRSSLKGL